MQKHIIKKGLSLPIDGSPSPTIHQAKAVTRVALLGDDYNGMKPTLAVKVGDQVKKGQVVFEDKKTPGVKYTAPAAGTVVEINRGAKRKFESLVIEVSGEEEVTFDAIGQNWKDLNRDYVASVLVESGLWTTLRTRPFDKVPSIESVPSSIFVTAIDTDPLAVNPEIAVAQKSEEFLLGLRALTQLTDHIHVCVGPTVDVPGEGVEGVEFHVFDGPHPAGLPGTHIHLIDPVGPNKTVWHIGYQDVSAIGTLVLTGKLDSQRYISIGGPAAKEPRLLLTCVGASLDELTENELNDDGVRVISGSVLSGRRASAPVNFLGRFHNQISLLAEGNHRDFLGWQKPGFDQFSVTRAFASALNSAKSFAMTTSKGGSKRSMVPIGSYEKIMPLDILPTQLLRALIVGDTEQAQLLGCLELAEEDLALCTFVCPGKYEYGPILRKSLTTIEIDG
ncbi:MAG: Na(+)-translocating NADH-quinone reductase subunit A [Planctomycetaceae bacterium]